MNIDLLRGFQSTSFVRMPPSTQSTHLVDIFSLEDRRVKNFTYTLSNSSYLDYPWQDVLSSYIDELYAYSDPVVISLTVLYVPIFLLALLGNLMVLIVTLTSGGTKSATNSFLLNLCFADLLVTMICIPLTVGERLYKAWVYGTFLCKAVGYLQGISITASVLTIVALSCDRYLAINHPVKSRILSTSSKVRLVIVVIWALSALSMLPLCLVRIMEEHPLSHQGAIVYCHEQWPSNFLRKSFDVFLFVFIYVIPGAIVTGLYSATGCHLLKSDMVLRRQDSDVSSAGRMMAGRKRVARMLLILAALFALSWMPYHMIILYLDFIQSKFVDGSLYALHFSLLIGHSHSAQNPIVYCLMNNSFRRGLYTVLRCRCRNLSPGSPLTREGSVFSRLSPKHRLHATLKARHYRSKTLKESSASKAVVIENQAFGQKRTTAYRYSLPNNPYQSQRDSKLGANIVANSHICKEYLAEEEETAVIDSISMASPTPASSIGECTPIMTSCQRERLYTEDILMVTTVVGGSSAEIDLICDTDGKVTSVVRDENSDSNLGKPV